MKRLGVTGETADEIFYEAEPEAERLWMLMTKIQKTRRNYTTEDLSHAIVKTQTSETVSPDNVVIAGDMLLKGIHV